MKTLKKVILIIFDVIAVFLILWFVLGYINFGRISNEKEPVLVIKEYEYVKDEEVNIKVYDNIIYKIVVQSDEEKIYSLKLWFMDDYTEV